MYVAVQSGDPQEAKDLADTYAQVAREFIAVKMDTEQPNIFEEALLPSRPSSPNKSKNVLLGFVIGLVLSCGIIVVQFLMDDRLRSADDIEKYVQLPTLGVMPKQEKDAQLHRSTGSKGRKERSAMRQAKIKRFNALDYTGTEAINTICTNLSFSGRDCKRIAFTSFMPGAGKTYMCLNILHNMGQTRQARADDRRRFAPFVGRFPPAFGDGRRDVRPCALSGRALRAERLHL